MTLLNTTTDSSAARLDEVRGNPRHAGFVIKRKWERINATTADSLTASLNEIDTYLNPKADSQVYSGTFVQSALSSQALPSDAVNITQVLTKVKANTDSADAHIVADQRDPKTGGYRFTRAWEHINPHAIDTLMPVLESNQSYVNPKGNTEKQNGNFIVSGSAATEQEDRTYKITQDLVEVRKTAGDTSIANITVEAHNPKNDVYKISREWNYIDPYSIDTVMPLVRDVKSYDIAGTEDKWIVNTVKAVEQDDRTYNIIQDLSKVKTIGGDTTLDLLNPSIQRAKEAIHPFGEGVGIGRDIIYKYSNLDPASDTTLMVIADTKLVAKMSQNDSMINVQRRTTLEDDNTLSFWMLAQRKQRINWIPLDTGLYATPDHIETQFSGRDGEVRRKTWYGIDNGDYAYVKAYLDTNADTNFSVLGVTVRDNDDGSDDWTQTTIKQFNDTRTNTNRVNAHGITNNVVLSKHYDYDNYTSELSLPALALDTGYIVEDDKVWMDRNGLISRRTIATLPTPSNTVDSGVPATNEKRQISAGSTEMSGTGNEQTTVFDQVPIDDVGSVIARYQSTAFTDDHAPQQISYTDIGNGAARVSLSEKKINTANTAYYEEVTSSNNGQTASVRRIWPYIRDTTAVLYMGANGIANDTFQYNGDDYLPIRSHRTKHYDGTSTVWQLGAVARNTGGGVIIGESLDSEFSYGYVAINNAEIKLKTYQGVFSSFSEAINFADDGSLIVGPGGLARRGKVQLTSDGRWLAYKVREV